MLPDDYQGMFEWSASVEFDAWTSDEEVSNDLLIRQCTAEDIEKFSEAE